MFFKNIAQYSPKKLLVLNIIFHLLYFALLLIGPIVTIGIKYSIFEKVSEHVRLTGIGLILFITIGFYGYLKIKNAVKKLPEITLSQQKLKFNLEMVFNCIPILLLFLALSMTKSNIDLAYQTFSYCIIYILCAIFIDGFFLKYLAAEYEIRIKAEELLEIDSRKELLKKGKENEKKN
ncbi:MAG: hypothetical protein NC087_01960 [Anaeroplasma bactoclasticum]|nr:hypothetical protein [Anaeroplasma bactoclasticum]